MEYFLKGGLSAYLLTVCQTADGSPPMLLKGQSLKQGHSHLVAHKHSQVAHRGVWALDEPPVQCDRHPWEAGQKVWEAEEQASAGADNASGSLSYRSGSPSWLSRSL